MRKVILIGTVHLGLTPIDELIDEVISHNPDRILIEIDQDGNGAQEMKQLLQWCKDNSAEYHCFDEAAPAEQSASGPTEKEIVDFTKAIQDKLQGVSWKDLNNPSVWKETGAEEINQAFTDKFYDPEKIKDREKLLDKNISNLLTEGTNVVVTGAGHMTRLLDSIPGSTAPLRH